MITIKKKHNLSDPFFLKLLNTFNNVIRYSYNRRVKDNITSLSELEQYVKLNMNNIDCLDASWIKTAVKKSFELKTEHDDKEDKSKFKLYFGGKSNFFKRKYHKINTLNKSLPLDMRGSTSDSKGNRKGELINNIFIFKPIRGVKWEIELKLSKNEKRMIDIVSQECLLNINYFNFKIDKNYVYISFNEPQIIEYKHKYKNNRFLGIDLNPNYIALSIQDIHSNSNKEIFKEIIDLKELHKTNKHKKKHELSHINLHIIKLCKQYNVEYVCLEELIIKSKDHNKGKKYNQLVNIDWNRNFTVNNLVKWLNIYGIKYKKLKSHYSSFIGQMKYEEDFDSISASKEISYRGYLSKSNKDIWLYINEFLSNEVTTRWKKMLPNVNTYKEVYNYYKKNSKTSYRVLFNDEIKSRYSYFRLNHHKSFIDLIMV